MHERLQKPTSKPVYVGLYEECARCGEPWIGHGNRQGHRHESPYEFDEMTDVQVNHRLRLGTFFRKGLLSPKLPLPADRRRIRESAGYTQQDVGEALMVSAHAVGRWERVAGYLGDRRLPGREPTGEIRGKYARLLNLLQADQSRR